MLLGSPSNMTIVSFRMNHNSLSLFAALLLSVIHTSPSFAFQQQQQQPPRSNRGRMTALSAAASTASSASQSQLKVAIIGSGAAGLAAARQFTQRGIEPIVFEKDSLPGGVWNYVRNARDRPMYQGLRTNLPRELVAYREKPWGSDGKTPSYVTHADVQKYLSDYAEELDLNRFIRYGCRVCRLSTVFHEFSAASTLEGEAWPKLKLEWHSTTGDASEDAFLHSEMFDAVAVCNGHYSVPSNPTIPGLEANFSGDIMHSIEYDDPSIFAGKTVLCIGGRASGSDIAREISYHARRVYLSDSACKPLVDGQPHEKGNVKWVPRTHAVEGGGAIRFSGGCKLLPTDVDVIIFCSGYDYDFPFINDSSGLDDTKFARGERRVSLLHEHLWHARHPNLAFLGLQHSVVPFPYFELQAQAMVARLVNETGSIPFPNLEARLAAAKEDRASGGPSDGPGRVEDTHYLGSFQWDYCRKMARIAGSLDGKTERFLATNKAIYDHSGSRRKGLFPGGEDIYRGDKYVRDDEDPNGFIVQEAMSKVSSV